MRCPSCTQDLLTLKIGELELDACQNGCGGIWFDATELVKIDEQSEFPGSPILQLAQKKETVHIDSTKPKKCPKCPDEPLVRQFLDVKREIEMDQCWNCGGIWLDVGELNQVRAQYSTYAERAAAVNQYIDNHIVDTTKELNLCTKEQLLHYHEHTKSRFSSCIYAFRRLLGLEEL